MKGIFRSKKSLENSEWQTWRKDTTAYAIIERGLDVYLQQLGLKKEMLSGKKILDLGSSKTEKFSQDVSSSGLNAEVFSLNPDLKSKKYRQILRANKNQLKKSVAATAQELPFKDECFDIILASWSVPKYLLKVKERWLGFFKISNPEGVKKMFDEIARVLRPGGEARFFPVYPEKKEQKEILNPIFEELKSKGILVGYEESEEKNVPDAKVLVVKKPDAKTDSR